MPPGLASFEAAPTLLRVRSEGERCVPIVEHFRLDASRKLGRALGVGAGLVTIGAIAMASSIYVGRSDPSRSYTVPRLRGEAVTADGAPIDDGPSALEVAIGMFGIACIVAGGATAIVGLKPVLAEESYLALTTDGALYRSGEQRSFVPWADIEEVRWDGAAVQFVRHDGSAWERTERFAGIDGAALAKRASEVRRKALFGLIK